MFEPGWLEMITPDLQRIGPVQSKQVALIKRCVDFIDHQIPENRPLWAACRWAEDCWRADHGQRPPLMSARIPYVGPEYPSQRIAVVAINSRDTGRAGDEIQATAGVVEWLAQGHRDYGARSFFHYRVASVVHTAIRSSAGETVEEMPDPPVAATALAASARLQAVQCSPQSSSRRSPTSAMTRHCPEFLLRGQLEILAPRLLILLGAPAHRAIETPTTLDMAWNPTWAESERCFSRGQTQFEGQTMTVLAFHHPSHTGWVRSWRAYLASLRAHPLSHS